MEGAVEIFTALVPTVSVIGKSDSNGVTVEKKFSAGSLFGMIVFGLIGVGISALL